MVGLSLLSLHHGILAIEIGESMDLLTSSNRKGGGLKCKLVDNLLPSACYMAFHNRQRRGKLRSTCAWRLESKGPLVMC